MKDRRESVGVAVMAGKRRAEPEAYSLQYVAGSEARVRPPVRPDPRSQQVLHESSGLGRRGAVPRPVPLDLTAGGQIELGDRYILDV